jgi:glutamate-5-semialdehyde dehydrogenase
MIDVSAELRPVCLQLAAQAKDAARQLACVRTDVKDRWLRATADALVDRQADLLQANSQDLEQARADGLSEAMLDRLRLTPARIAAMAEGLRAVAALPDPVGRIIEGGVRPNGLLVQKVGVPLGVILFLYESRPNVTTDAAGLCLKSGNAVILRGGKEAQHTNAHLHALLTQTLAQLGLPAHAVQRVPTTAREAVGILLTLDQYIDLVIPRGGESLIRRVVAEARMPVLKHYRGNCHIYVDAAADLDMAERIIINAKCQRPAVCNAVESLLVHQAIARAFVPRLARSLQERGVEIRGCDLTRSLASGIATATEADYAAEYNDLIVSLKVVENLDEAIVHIERFGSGHTDAIITNDLAAARRFTQMVDSAAVMVNASTRFNDGYELGLGAEIGISTDKFHARGPCGLNELTSYKYIVQGDGQLRS